MRVAVLSTYGESCGIATYSEALVPALERAGAHVEVFAPRLPSFDKPRGPQPRRMWNRNRAFGVEALGVVRAIHAMRADVVHAQINLSLYSSRFLFTLATALRAIGVPLVATLHGRRGGSWGRNFKVTRLLFALGHASLIVHSDAHAAELQRDHVHVIPHGVTMPHAQLPIDEAKRALGLDPKRLVLAHFGFLVPDKGVAEVLRAVADLRAGNGGPPRDVFYWIAGATHGTGESKDYTDELRRLIAHLNLTESARLTGDFAPDDRVQRELAAADWVVLNYKTGGSQGASGAARTALASGRPIAVSEASIFDDLRDASHTLREPLTSSLRAMLDDATLIDRTQARALTYCEERSWPRIAERHLALYASLKHR